MLNATYLGEMRREPRHMPQLRAPESRLRMASQLCENQSAITSQQSLQEMSFEEGKSRLISSSSATTCPSSEVYVDFPPPDR